MKSARSSAELQKIRECIIDAALSIIGEQGFPSLTMRRLALRMRMSAPNLYNYFKSKDEIYISIVIKGFQMLKDEMVRVYRANDDPAQRAHAMMAAYIGFGTTNKAYYDIMFTWPTPKYNDYIGTPYEKLSGIELKTSMEIARLAMDALLDLRKDTVPFSGEETVHHMVKVWIMLHGMVSLSNSNIAGYVTPDMQNTCNRIIDELIEQYRV